MKFKLSSRKPLPENMIQTKAPEEKKPEKIKHISIAISEPILSIKKFAVLGSGSIVLSLPPNNNCEYYITFIL